uniref:C2h2-type zn-finger protein n=1 Tax=Culex tarsalis TaxID=7177 RepID=A0A1Q3EZV1_CULTA
MKDSDGLELQVNANEMCRTCLAAELPPDQLKPIFCNEIVDGRIVPFPKVLELTMGFKPTKNEVLPKNVCIACKTKLKELYSFKDKVCKSEDLLYEIFNCEKPPEQKPTVVSATRPPTSTAETQTDCMRIDESNAGSYRTFLTLQKAPKPATRDAAISCCVPSVESGCQTVPAPKPASRNASVQVTPPQKLLKHSGIQVNIHDELELEVLHFDVVEMMDESEPEQQQQQQQLPSEQLDQVLEEATAQSEMQDFETDEEHPEEPLRPVGKLEAVEEPEDPCEYLSYEALEEPPDSDSTKGKQPEKEATAAPKPVSECQYCQYSTEDKAAFKEHLNVHHQTLESILVKADYFRCINCFSVFNSPAALTCHFNEGPCVAIGNDLSRTEEVDKHEKFYSHGFDICLPRMKSFHKIDKMLVACGSCNMQFKTLEEALIHYTIHEQELESQQDVDQIWENNDFSQIHYCGICSEPFPDATFIRQHVYFHRKAFDCPFDCPALCFTFGSLTEHIKRHLTTAEEPQPPSATPKPALKKPKPTSAPSTELVCEVCSKSFNSKASLKAHTKNHYADKRHACAMCPKSFIQKSDLTIHIRSHTDERPFACTVPGCGKKFRTSSHRRDHMSTHAAVNTYQCEFCQKMFKAERILQGHLRLHTGLKPFECELCGKAFSRKQHLKLHMKTHEKETNELIQANS